MKSRVSLFAMYLRFFCTFFSVLFFCTTVVAQTTADVSVQEKLVAQLQKNLQTIEDEMRRDEIKSSDTNARLDSAAADLESARQALQAENNDINQMRVKNAEFTYMLKERELNRHQEKMQSDHKTLMSTRKKIQQTQDEIQQIQQSHVLAEKLIVEKQQKQIALDKELAEMKAKSAAAKKEVERLKNILIEQKQPLNSPQPSAADTKSASKTVLKTPLPSRKDRAELPPKLSAEQKHAIEQYNRIANLLNEKGIDNNEGQFRELIIDAMVDFWIESKHSIQFGYLGYGQYIAQTKLRHGDATFIVGDKRWRYTVPEKDDNTRYLFLLDETAEDGPQLYYFRKDLLALDD